MLNEDNRMSKEQTQVINEIVYDKSSNQYIIDIKNNTIIIKKIPYLNRDGPNWEIVWI